jgi:hypothetical protein
MQFELISSIVKPIAGFSVAGITFMLGSVIPPTSIPTWIDTLGLPIVFLIAVAYALLTTHKALLKSESGRREDWEKFSSKLEGMVLKSEESRNALTLAQTQNATEIHSLIEHLKSKP